MREYKTASAMIAPAILVLVFLIGYPFLISVYTSLTNKQIGLPGKFIGLGNYAWLFQDELFWLVLENTAVYTVAAVIIKLILGITLALLLFKIPRGQNVLKAAVLLPWVIPATLSTLAWKWIFDPNFSVLNWYLKDLGLIHQNIPWLSVTFLARSVVILVNVWRGLPFFTICLLAGLVSIPQEFYDAARVDGAGAVRRFVHITIPLLKPILFIVTLFSVVMTVSDFIIVHIMTKGGPLQTTHLFGTLAYQIGLAGTRIGMGAAISLFIFPILAVSAYVLLRVVRSGEEYA
ncbi:MAG: sugar ABC transporter permease [Deltaproteobacteria bacterium]|nr:sugar ABC transporter permease [Deltaproteobacteria bacterium]MBW1961017.1 sugar ABC transporter permease [Deltaproteobacteria bacterium]MBW2152784.1 sugar ABC transporter permease [Deltaproteobacteria bacterium]